MPLKNFNAVSIWYRARTTTRILAIIRTTKAGMARTTSTSVKEKGISEVRKPTGTLIIRKIPRAKTVSVNPGKYGSSLYRIIETMAGRRNKKERRSPLRC
jgi:hypothetical protein